MRVLVTGGAGYIGSHTCVELLDSGYEIVVVDNLSNRNVESINRVEMITGKKVLFYKSDLRDREVIEKIFSENKIDAVIHFAGLKAVGESNINPLRYYSNNISGTIILCEAMQKFNVNRMVFSSSATVYGVQDNVPFSEELPLQPTNPYGRTKLIIEEILRDLNISNREWRITILRYFNPIGAHNSGLIGEDPKGVPNNLVPYITQVAIGKLPYVNVFGNDYPTHDGTGIRDYIHVVDLAKGHIKALDKIMSASGVHTYNLGTGNGYSVMQMLQAFEKIAKVKIPYQIKNKRPGDIPISYADCSKAQKELNWVAKKGLYEMCLDSWNWQIENPNGFESEEEKQTSKNI
jgi:UDP-glucose 4-epimerase